MPWNEKTHKMSNIRKNVCIFFRESVPRVAARFYGLHLTRKEKSNPECDFSF